MTNIQQDVLITLVLYDLIGMGIAFVLVFLITLYSILMNPNQFKNSPPPPMLPDSDNFMGKMN